MRVLIYGAGAIGGYLGAVLSRSGVDVTILARGATFDVIKSHGLAVDWAVGNEHLVVHPPVCTSDESDGLFDVIFVTLKSMQIASSAENIVSKLRPQGCMVMVQNGLPWWYFQGIDSPWRGVSLSSLDPNGILKKYINLSQVIGAVIHKPVMVTKPGHLYVPEVRADRLVIGELDGRHRPRLDAIASMVGGAGLPVEITNDIRAAKWIKLMVNLVWNPLTALSQSPAGAIADFPQAKELVKSILEEGSLVAASVGIKVDCDSDAEFLRVTGNYTQIPSMLQDVRAGRPLEWQAILGSVIEIAGLTKVSVPTLKNIAACIGVLDQRIRSEGIGIGPVIHRGHI
jgi:2-dehydropantoate 2-reductase